jgi:acyl-CoA thioesterase
MLPYPRAMPVARFYRTDVTVDHKGTPLRVWAAAPDDIGVVRCVLALASDVELEGSIVGAFSLDSDVHARPGMLVKCARHAVARL